MILAGLRAWFESTFGAPTTRRMGWVAGSLAFAVATYGAAGGCSFVLDFDASQCDSTDECTQKFPNTACVEHVCTVIQAQTDGGGGTGGGGGCVSNAQCTEDKGEPALCRTPGSDCVTILTPKCLHVAGDFEAEQVLVYGYLAPFLGVHASVGEDRRKYIELALSEFKKKSNGGIPGGTDGKTRSLVVVMCHEDEGDNGPVTAYDHLTKDLGAAAILGPTPTGFLLPIAQDHAIPDKTMMLTKIADESVTSLTDSGLLWHFSSVVGEVEAIVAAFPTLEAKVRVAHNKPNPMTDPLKVSLVARQNSESTDFAIKLGQQLVFNGKSAEEQLGQYYNPHYYTKDCSGVSCVPVNEVEADEPDIIVYTGLLENVPVAEQIEKDWPTGGTPPRPYHVFDRGALSGDDTVLNMFKEPIDVNLKRRVFGATYGVDTNRAVYKDFRLQYFAEYNKEPIPEDSMWYDAMYILAYATVAAGQVPEVTGDALGKGMVRLLGPAGQITDVGPNGISDAFVLSVPGTTIDLDGAFGPLDFDQSTGVQSTDWVIWCVDEVAGEPVIEKSLTALNFASYNTKTQAVAIHPTGCAP